MPKQRTLALAVLLAAGFTGCSTAPAPNAKENPAPAARASDSPASSAPAAVPTPDSPPAPAKAASPSGGHTYEMKKVQVIDQQGFERPMPSSSMLIPTDWQFQGATTWNIKDACNTIQTSAKATGPDGRAFEIFPLYNWVWADDPTFLRQAAAQKAQFGTRACDVTPPVSAADYAKRIVARIRPNTTIAAIEPAPDLLQKLQDTAHQSEQTAAQYGLKQSVRADVAKARLKYMLNGQPVEEWIVVATFVTATLGPSYDPRTLRMTQAYSYNCLASMVAERAPQGQLDANSKFFDLLNSTYRVNPQWQGRVTQNAQQMQQIELKGIRDRSAIITKNAEDIRNIQQRSFENQQRSEEQNFKGFDQVIRGVESYRNPNTGETVELDNTFGHAWVSGNGTYVLSDQAGFNPNATLKGNWTPLEHVKP